MRKRRPGTRLAVALPEDWPRWISIALYLIFGSLFVAPTIWFLLDPTYTTFGLLECLAAILGVIFLVAAVNLLVLAILAGNTAVEISREPGLIGLPLEYCIVQGRACRHVLSLDATLKVRRPLHRTWEIALEAPLGPATLGEDGRRTIQGSLVLPEVPPRPLVVTKRPLSWFIEVRIRFKGGFVHQETHPLEVDRTNAEPAER